MRIKTNIGVGLAVVGLLAGIMVAGMASAQDKPEAAPAAPAAPAVAAPAAPAGQAVAPGLEAKPGEEGKGEGHGEDMSFITIVTRAGWFGVVIWIGLIVASIISVALIVDSFINIREAKISPKALAHSVREAMEQGDLAKAVHYCDETPTPLARILKAGFANVQEGFEVVQDSVGVAADLEGEKMLQRVTYLSVISNTTPMLGLIGTVQGMIFAFFTLGTQQAGAAQQAMLALNISHGLWATAIGLGTAVPATIFFYFFKNRATRIILQMEALTLDLIKALRNVEVVEE
jgi:biopolymer transport protein ExbB